LKGAEVRAVDHVLQDEWGIPDWHDAAKYLPSDIVEPSLFGWEFLRRSDAYRNEWDEWRDLRKSHHMLQTSPSFEIRDETSTDLFELSPPPIAGETWGEYNDRLPEGTQIIYRWKGAALADKWDVAMFDHLDPRLPGWRLDESRCFEIAGTLLQSFGHGLPMHYIGSRTNKRGIRQPKNGEALVHVSADENIEEQLKRIRIIIEGMQKSAGIKDPKIKKLQPEKFPMYLRVVDGRRAGASYGDISKVLLPKEDEKAAIDRLQKAYKAATSLIDSGWKEVRRLRLHA
jgi:hypothetical protein